MRSRGKEKSIAGELVEVGRVHLSQDGASTSASTSDGASVSRNYLASTAVNPQPKSRVNPSKIAVLTLVSLLAASGLAFAGPVAMRSEKSSSVTTWDAFAKGNRELELLAGAFWGANAKDTPRRPDYGFCLVSLRYGCMLTDPVGEGWCRGNLEFLVGAFGGPIWEGPGDYLLGADLNLRYNFVQPGAKVVPFIQITGGGSYSDIADDPVQTYLDSDWNFELGASLGLRWMLSERSALTAAFEWRHLSNAGSGERGYNGLGGMVGLSWFF
jgi:lipid A 3-O-deacylase